jgi:repressor LexA
MTVTMRQTRKNSTIETNGKSLTPNPTANSGKVSTMHENFDNAVKESRREGRRKLNKLSERQKNILNFIKEFIYLENLPPTVREIQEKLKITSTSVVDYNLKELVKKGYIQRGSADSERSIARGIQLTDEGWDYETEFQVPRFRAVDIRPQTTTFSVPMLGVIAAGTPIPDRKDADPEDVIELPPSLLPRNPTEVFALRVKGQSMIDVYINDGDIVLIKEQKKAEIGEIVAVWLEREQETTLKMWYPEPGKDKVQLRPANDSMKPIVTELSNVSIKGKLVGVIRTMA